MSSTSVQVQQPKIEQQTIQQKPVQQSVLETFKERLFKLEDPVRHNFLCNLFLAITCKIFYANLCFMAIRFSGLKEIDEKQTWIFYFSLILFVCALAIPVVITLEEKFRNKYPNNLMSLLGFITLISIASSLLNLQSYDENVWAISYLSLFSFLFIFVIGSWNVLDLSNTTHSYLLANFLLSILTIVYLIFSFFIEVSIHPMILLSGFIFLNLIFGYIIFDSKVMLEKGKIDPNLISFEELTKSIVYLYANFVYRIISTGVNIKEPN